jgi:putative mRNA 3-end processing factor
MIQPTDLLVPTPQGLYSPLGGFHVDPMRPVERALVSHGHSDHARPGHDHVLATRETLAIMEARYGAGFCRSQQIAPLGERIRIGDVSVSFHPAGHVLGSAQIAVEARGLRVVFSGDYKRAADPTCVGFEPVPCQVFITEATFGLPVFRHPPLAGEVGKLIHSLLLFPERTHLIGAYSLGKAQRLMSLIRAAGYDAPILIHGALAAITTLYQREGIDLGRIEPCPTGRQKPPGGGIVICPPSAIREAWARRFDDPVTAFASGWMRVRARARQCGAELPLVVSDHSDWDDLTITIRETGAENVWVTHGQEEALCHWCTGAGIAARPLNLVGYDDGGEGEDARPASGEAMP